MIMENLTHILIFKTNIKTESDKIKVRELFDKTPGIEEWSVDCDDIDCVLRVVSHALNEKEIIELVVKNGFQCQDLD